VACWAIDLAGMPPDTVNKVNADINKVLADPTAGSLFVDFGLDALPSRSTDCKTLSHIESVRWSNAIKTPHVQLD
jgi:hypothetical protein